jgi:hypothetical protein
MRYSKGVSWIDDCRIGFEERQNQQKIFANGNGGVYKQSNTSKNEYVSVKGRFPANILVCDDMLNDGVITQYNKNRTDNGTYLGGHRKEYVGTDDNDVVKQIKGQFFNDKGSNSRYYDIDKWFNNLIDV